MNEREYSTRECLRDLAFTGGGGLWGAPGWLGGYWELSYVPGGYAL